MLFQENVSVNMNQCNRFRNSTVLYFVFHQDKVDASFCGRMFHPPLLAVIVSFFASVKSGISIQLVAIANLNVSPSTLLDFRVTTQNEIGFPIRVGRFIFYPSLLMKGQYRPSST